MLQYTIYQIIDENVSYRLKDWGYAKDHGYTDKDYNRMYSLTLSDNGQVFCKYNEYIDETEHCKALERIFLLYNDPDRIKNFEGHKLDVSDVVRLEDKEYNFAYYYRNSAGWVDVTEATRTIMRQKSPI